MDLSLLATVAQGLAGAEPDDVAMDIRVRSRLLAMSLRGDSYVHHSRELARALYGPLADWMIENLGFSMDDVIRVTEGVGELMTTRVNQLFHEAREVIRTAPKLMEAEASAETKKTLRRLGATRLERYVGVHCVEDHLTAAMSFTREDLLRIVDIPPAKRLDAVLARFSADVGSAGTATFRSPIDANPLNRTPIVRYEDRYLLPVPGMIAREYPYLCERDVLERRQGFSRYRARVLDELAVSWIRRMLPDSRAFTRLYYEIQEDGTTKQGELDGLVLFDRFAIVVEGKATPLSPQSRRGDVRRLVQDLERSVEDAWGQAARARQYLLSIHDALFRDEHRQIQVTVAAGSLEKVYIVNPTLHALADHAVQLPRLTKLGLFPTGEVPWSVFINDLRIISETIRYPAEFLYYMEWRASLPLGERLTAVDELDLFGSYLLREQVRDFLADSNASIHLQSGVDFDAFYLGELGDAPPAERPRMFSIPLVDRYLERLSRQRPAGWVSAAGVVLELALLELAALDVATPRVMASLAPTDVEVVAYGSMALVGVGPRRRWPEAYAATKPTLAGFRNIIFVSLDYADKPMIAWSLQT